MSNIDCDYQDEITGAMQMVETATSNVERADWLFLALAWQTLARCHDENFQRTASAAEIEAGPKQP
jgi:hypothetical protein